MAVRIGADIESLCGKCGDVWHVVVAAHGEQVLKVQCKQCGGQHKHRPPGGSAAKARPTRAAAGTKAAAGSRTRKAAAKAGPKVEAADRPPRPYSPKERFEVGDVVEHGSFGRGVVQSVPAPGKVEVWFEGAGAPKLLVQAR